MEIKQTLLMGKTGFEMKGNLAQKEPLILKKWQEDKVYEELLEKNKAAFDPRVFITPIMDTVMYGNIPDDDTARICKCIEDGVKEVVGTLVVKFGSYGKAPKVEVVTLEQMAERYKKAGI